jgi:hypothetical protein
MSAIFRPISNVDTQPIALTLASGRCSAGQMVDDRRVCEFGEPVAKIRPPSQSGWPTNG